MRWPCAVRRRRSSSVMPGACGECDASTLVVEMPRNAKT